MLITGGGSGVGLACARAFESRGARLILCDCDAPALAQAGRHLGAFARYCDVTADSSVAIFAEELSSRFDGIDVLINAAGDGYVRSLGMMRITLVFLPSMRRERTPKHVFNIAPDFEPAGQGDALFPNVSTPRNFRRLSASLAIQARGSAVRVATIMPRRAMGSSVGAAIGTKCDEADVVAAVMSAVFGGAAAHDTRNSCRSAATPSAKRAGDRC